MGCPEKFNFNIEEYITRTEGSRYYERNRNKDKKNEAAPYVRR